MFLTWLDNPEKNVMTTTEEMVAIRPLILYWDARSRCSCRWGCRCTSSRNTVLDWWPSSAVCPLTMRQRGYYFVHAGVDLALEKWRETSDYQKVWIENHSMKRRIRQANGSSLVIHRSMDCSHGQSVPKIFGFQIKKWVSMGALFMEGSSWVALGWSRELSKTMSF